ncbi:hypothetical protein B0H21DRAFT_517618 [Amylocystis lapponica]|nr:hypothetical protein B0H21DRAFT_517618 [Amylocystis lapponica]
MSTYFDPTRIAVSADVQNVVRETAGVEINEIRSAGRDEFNVTYDVVLENGRQLLLRIPSPNTKPAILESEIATLKYMAERTSIPVPKVLAFNLDEDQNHSKSIYAILEKPLGVSLDTVFHTLSHFEQNLVVAQVAKWMVELLRHRFDAIGSLILGDQTGHPVGPIVRRAFCIDGRAKLALDRGPFKNAKAYYFACAQRELDCSRVLFVQDAPPTYQRDLDDGRLQVERIAGLFGDLVQRCEGLDEDDPTMAQLSLDIHQLGLKSFFVDSSNSSKIISVSDWQFISTRPLWCCARLPTWLQQSLSGGNDNASRLTAIFRAEIARIDGIGSDFLRVLDLEGTRCTLDDLSEYDAFKDGFLVLPALENILATLPGHEDFAGLNALLDPTTLTGRVARINLLTHGSNAMFLAMTPPHSPDRTSKDPPGVA